jgi:hypothetical protein
MTSEIRWGLPGPTDPDDRARATAFNFDRNRLEEPVDWTTEGLPDEPQRPPAAEPQDDQQ